MNQYEDVLFLAVEDDLNGHFPSMKEPPPFSTPSRYPSNKTEDLFENMKFRNMGYFND